MVVTSRTLSGKGGTCRGLWLFGTASFPRSSSLMVTEHRRTQGRESTVPALFLLCLARRGETACGENIAPMALEQESILQKQCLWKWDGLDLGPDPTW